jgi:hypothetical protein
MVQLLIALGIRLMLPFKNTYEAIKGVLIIVC